VVSTNEKQVNTYLAKIDDLARRWDAAHELARPDLKRGCSADSRSAFDLLVDSANGDAPAGRLFVAYARDTKGKHPLHWSKDARKDLLQGEHPLPSPEPEPAGAWQTVVELTKEQFYALLDARKKEELLQAVVKYAGDVAQVTTWLSDVLAAGDALQTYRNNQFYGRASPPGGAAPPPIYLM